MDLSSSSEVHNCTIQKRKNPRKRKEKVLIGCGAGFSGDRPLAALKLLQRVEKLDYIVLECLAERTLADHYYSMLSGGFGYDYQISDWMLMLLPVAVEKGVCIITNMGAMDPCGAQAKVLEASSSLGLNITVAVAYEVVLTESGWDSTNGTLSNLKGATSTYLGAAPVVYALEKYEPNVVITSRVADAALFLAPMVYELGWDWSDMNELAQGALAGHLLECGCHLTGGYFMHPGDKFRDMTLSQLLDLSLPFTEVSFDGEVRLRKACGSGGVLNVNTCAEQLLYEIGDPGAYITPDVVIDLRNVSFQSISNDEVLCSGAKPSSLSAPDKLLQLIPKRCGWRGRGEISYGGHESIARANIAEFLVRSWMEEVRQGSSDCVVSYIVGLDSVNGMRDEEKVRMAGSKDDVRLHMDGMFEEREHALQLVREFTALYTNGPAGGGGISTGHKMEMILEKQLIDRVGVHWRAGAKQNEVTDKNIRSSGSKATNLMTPQNLLGKFYPLTSEEQRERHQPALPVSGKKIPLYCVAHSRTGDKGNDLNFSIIPHFPPNIKKLKAIITPQWVKNVLAPLMNRSSFLTPEAISDRDKTVPENVEVEIYQVPGIQSLNVVVRGVLDGGVNCSRRIDRHGKTVSDIILMQEVVLPP